MQRDLFGVSAVSTDRRVCQALLEKIAGVASCQKDALLTDRKMELIPIGDELFRRSDAN